MLIEQDMHCTAKNADGSYDLVGQGRTVHVLSAGEVTLVPGADYHVRVDAQLWGGAINIAITPK